MPVPPENQHVPWTETISWLFLLFKLFFWKLSDLLGKLVDFLSRWRPEDGSEIPRPTTWDVWNLVNTGINYYINWLAGFQPSTVGPTKTYTHTIGNISTTYQATTIEVIPFIGLKHATKIPIIMPGRDVRLQHLLDHAVENTGAWTSRPGFGETFVVVGRRMGIWRRTSNLDPAEQLLLQLIHLQQFLLLIQWDELGIWKFIRFTDQLISSWKLIHPRGESPLGGVIHLSHTPLSTQVNYVTSYLWHTCKHSFHSSKRNHSTMCRWRLVTDVCLCCEVYRFGVYIYIYICFFFTLHVG